MQIFRILPFFLLMTGFVLATENRCISCHNDLDEEFVSNFTRSTHYRQGILCHHCHGGNPDTDDMEEAMSSRYGFRGKISRKEIPTFCDRCHGDIEYMRNFNPSIRVDQYKEYLTSMHGKMFRKGDMNVAVCTDCHTSHAILPPDDIESSVHPANVASTCSRCHDNQKLMQSYGLRADQYQLYKQSIHAKLMDEKQDYSAPTCNDCHGNHGAVPPGIRNIAEVCGQCHVLQSEYYQQSFHAEIFNQIGEKGCETCHSNHKIIRLTDEHLTDPTNSVCSRCHTEGDAGFEENRKISRFMRELDSTYHTLMERIEQQERTGITTEQARYDMQQMKEVGVKIRVAIHAMSAEKLQPLFEAGMKVATQISNNLDQKEQDFRNRKRGLYISILFMMMTVTGIYFYTRYTFPRK